MIEEDENVTLNEIMMKYSSFMTDTATDARAPSL
jgi:hypothetical protein